MGSGYFLLHHYNYWVSVVIMMVGLYGVIASSNLIKKLIGLAIFQTAVLLLYISVAYVKDARFPILGDGATDYINPLPHVLMLTAIVVGVATLAVGLALAVRIKQAYGTLEEEEILLADNAPVRKPAQKTKIKHRGNSKRARRRRA
ncbi:MAG: Na+/H+ antiporter subunit C [Proteobacteria bacterium]|nr:Na+/H+ antiporter subunit C [Pseudomonadota bacterium]